MFVEKKNKLIITAKQASKSAIDKIIKAGGEITLSENKKIERKEERKEKAKEKIAKDK
ncbi:MAG: uL15 family ribosomal protein [Nanoarchaeota archaeon]|nr:uL15 family ribosomal protein [Nanoarchaeota archaeon]MBU4116762.1 uL15 family ribosomal protein [Nanoarchaeota archaeon]